MKILFVQPFILPTIKSKLFQIIYKRLSHLIIIVDYYQNLLQMGSVTPKEHEIKLIDERFENINLDENCDIVVITTDTGYALRAYEIADEFRKRKKTVILGGYHPTMMPEEAKQHADSVLVGEVEINWPILLKDYEKKELKPFYKQEKPIDPTLLPPANRGLIKKYRRPLARIQATRGCSINCIFCRVPAFEGTALRKRPVENVLEEIKSIPQKFIFFIDGSLTLDPKYTKELFRALKGTRKKYFVCGNADVLAKDDELLKLAKKAGVIIWYVGFESINQKTLDAVNKKANIVDRYKETVNKIHKYKMAASGAFILGLDNDKLETFDKTYQELYNLDLDLVELNTLTPFPGTPLYKKLEEEGRIISKNWFHYREGQSGTIPDYQPKTISAEKLQEEIRKRIFNKWYASNISTLKIKFMLRGLKHGFYPFIFRVFGSFFNI